MSDTTKPLTIQSFIRSVGLIIVSALISACAQPGYTVKSRPAAPASVPVTTVYFYPAKGQSEDRQERDRYECYLWAKKQTGFDPGQIQLAPRQQIEVTPVAPSGSDTAAGAVTGAVIGSMVAGPHDRGFGLIFGAITGAAIGAASDSARQQQAKQIEQQYNADESRRYAGVEKQARDYQRAMTACLEGRDYTVR